ncbi:MAG: response regulator [Gammaproteobacteria bacterium]
MPNSFNSIRDLTAQKAVSIAKEAAMDSLLQDFPIAFYWVDKEGIFLGGNDKELAILGLSSIKELIGKHTSDLCADPAWENSKKVMESNKSELLEEVHLNPDGTKTYFFSIKKPLRNSEGDVIGLLGVSIDITDRKIAEQKLAEALKKSEAANEAKTQFLENMRHDLRTPLSGILGFAELIKAEADKPEKTREYIDNLIASSRTLFEFLNEILDAIKATSGEIPLLKKKFNMKDAFNKVILLQKAKAATKKLNLVYDYDKKLAEYIVGDPVRLQRILLELTSNALKFTSKGEVKISVKLAKKEGTDIAIKLIVADTGMGFSEKRKQDIFTRFTRLTPSFKGISQGSGLGLTIVKQFLEDLKGEISVRSEEGKGSIFTCVISLQEAMLQDASDMPAEVEGYVEKAFLMRPILPLKQKEKTTRKGKNWNVLLVEDDAFMGKLGRIILERMKCAVDIAVDGAKAVNLARENRYDLILMDIGLPDIDGYEVARHIREQEVKKDHIVPIVALSAHTSAEYSQHCMKVGMNAVLSKPFTEEKARDICSAFIPGWTESTKEKKPPRGQSHKVTGKIIDLALMRKNYGNNEKTVRTLLASIKKDLPNKINSFICAYQNKDLKTLQIMTHKIRGSASYCGAARTQGACAKLDDYLLEGNEFSTIGKLYKKCLVEIRDFQKAILRVRKI